MLTKGAIGNLVNRYRAVLKKCHLINTFGSLAVASMLVMGGAAVAMGGTQTAVERSLLSYTGDGFLENFDAVDTTNGTFDWKNTDGVLTIKATNQQPGDLGVVTNLYKDSDNGTLDTVSSKGMAITGSTFEHNKNSNGGAAVSLWGNGGTGTEALSHSISDTTFTGNESTNLGGAVAIFKWSSDYAVNSNTTFEDVVFTNNKTTSDTGRGGAIYAESENVTIIGDKTSDTDYTTSFTGNSAYQGGAVYVTKGSPLTVDGVDFTNNSATAQGGAIYTDPHADAKISNSLFEENSADAGGAIALWGDGGSDNIELNQLVENTTFKGNTANRKGGAVAILKYDGAARSNTSFNNVTFENNVSKGTGGAVHIESENVSITDTTFIGNSADLQGGAIYNDQDSTLDVDGASFKGNSAAQGGAVANMGGTVTIGDNVTFTENEANGQNYGGGAIYSTGGSITIGNGAQLVGNYLTQPVSESDNGDMRTAGGAIAAWGSTKLSIGENALFENNGYNKNTGKAAWSSGGAIYLDTNGTDLAEMTIGNGATFKGNVAGSLGGAIYAADSKTDISSANFKNNKAGSWGGAMFVGNYFGIKDAQVSVDNTTFTGNEAGKYGGAIASNGGVVNLSNTTFTGNSAGLQGGAVYNDGALTFSGDNLFENNTAADVANDVHNKGILTVADGTTLMNSGYTQEGETSALIVKSGATLGIAMPDLGGVAAENGEALLALGQNLDLSNGGSLKVGNISADNDAQLAFGSDSMLVVDGKVAQNGAAITGNDNDKITVEKGSRLYIANAQADEAYTITDRINTSENEYWDAANLLAGRLIEADITTTPDGDIVEALAVVFL